MGRMKDLWIKQHEEALDAEESRFKAGLRIIEEEEEKIDDWEAWKREEQASEANEKPTILLEDVRKVLAGLSRDGFTAEVRGILKKYGASKLSEVSPDDYESILEDAKGINNGK